METEITIFDIGEKDIPTNKSQKELEYENLQKNSKLPSHHFASFFELETIEEKIQKPKTNIPSVICKYILQYCMPIITKEDIFHISLQTETFILGYNATSNSFTVIPANEQFRVVGIRLPTIFIRRYDPYMLVHQDHVDNIALANTGQYGVLNHQTMKYTLQRNDLTHPGLPKIDDEGSIIMFKSNEDALEKLTYLLDYIEFLESFYNTNVKLLYNEFKVIPYLPDYVNNGREKWNIERNSKNDKLVLKNLDDTIVGSFGNSYDIDVQLALDQNGLFFAYNIGRFIGVDDPLFKKERIEKKRNIEYSIEYRKQLNDGFTKKLEIAKKQTIALNKYNISDIDTLDKKQKEIVDLEFSKLEKFLNKDMSVRGKEIQKMFYRLRNSFVDITSERLAAAIDEIRKEVTSSELNKLELLEGGVCPHVFYYGEEMLKNFGKPWLNTELRDFVINRFSLPKDRAGYFCKICGEQLAEADNEDVMRFMGGERIVMNQTDDPLQTMIWKEAMYIITTYVKFNTPIPLKPLVNSLASGLRSIIGDEESKLFRSKTNTTDSIKDTLNLYAAIYVYAAICALMINNPNKMIFGKDKPNKDIRESYQQKNIKEKVKSSKERNTEDVAEDNAKISKITSTGELGELKDVGELLEEPGESEYMVDEAAKKEETEYLNSLRSSPVTGDAAMNEILGKSEYMESSDEDKSRLIRQKIQKTKPVEKPSKKKKSDKTHSRKKREIVRENKYAKYKYITGGKTTKDIKLYERYILTTALNLIVLTKDAIIKRLKNMNIDIIKQIFLKNAYGWAKSHAKPMNIEEPVYAPRVQTIVTTDPFYNYLYYAKRLAYNSGIDKHYPPGYDDIQSMLGRSAEDIDHDIKSGDKDTYDTITLPAQWKFTRDERSFRHLYDEYTYRSFLSMAEYIKDKIYQKEAVPQSPYVKAYYEKYQDVLDMEKTVRFKDAVKKLRPIFKIEWLNDIRAKYNDFSSEKMDLAQHYCPSGERHKVGSFIYQREEPVRTGSGNLPKKTSTKKTAKVGRKRHYYGAESNRVPSKIPQKPTLRSSRGGSAEIEYTKKEIVEMLESKNVEALAKFATLKLINERCEKCKNLIRTAQSSDRSDKALSNMFKKIDDVLAFYQYFETRCPKGDLHDINDNVCSKCGLHTDFKKKSDDAYYNKYIASFKKVEREKQSIAIASLKQAQESLDTENLKPAPVDYKFSLQKTAEWSQLADVKYNILSNLGLSEGHKFEDIEKARINPIKQLEDLQPGDANGYYKTQAMKIKGYLLHILRDYNMLINYENVVDIPLEIKEILEIQKKIELSNLQKNMPQFKGEFMELDDKYKYALTPQNYANFLLEYLASMIIHISRDSADKYKPMAKMLVKYFTSNIIMQEKLFSKAESIYAKMAEDITKAESDSEDEVGVSGDEYAGQKTDTDDGDDENAVETYENEIDYDGMDVENADDIWENE